MNPFIYATTIPGFKAMIRNGLIRYGCTKGEVSHLPQMETTDNWTSKGKDTAPKSSNTELTIN